MQWHCPPLGGTVSTHTTSTFLVSAFENGVCAPEDALAMLFLCFFCLVWATKHTFARKSRAPHFARRSTVTSAESTQQASPQRWHIAQLSPSPAQHVRRLCTDCGMQALVSLLVTSKCISVAQLTKGEALGVGRG